MESNKQEIMKNFQVTGEKDTGSSDVQISILSAKIDYLTKHLKEHQKDKHARRGLIQTVNARRKLLDYMRRKSFGRYRALITKLGIRR